MIFKLKVIILFVLVLGSNGAHSQNVSSNKVFDMNNHLILSWKGSDFDSCVFVTNRGNKIPVDLEVRYKGGYDSLRVFCDSVYCRIMGNDFQELNEKIQYFILFDNNLNIKEIRICKVPSYINGKYIDVIKKVLLKTKGNWILREAKSVKGHVYGGIFILI